MTYVEKPPPEFDTQRLHIGSTHVALWKRNGQGPAIVLVHGNSSSKCAFRELLVQPALRERRMIALDLPGCGESLDAPDDHYTIPALARTLIEAIRRLALAERPWLVGWSLGGHVALEAIAQNPNFLRALVLTGTPPCGPGLADVATTFHPSELMAVTTGEFPPDELLVRYVTALYGTSSPPPELTSAARRFHGRLRRIFSEHWMQGHEGTPQRDIVATWPRPIAVIQGDQEPFFDNLQLARNTWKNLWRHQTQFVPNAGHAPFHQRPSEYAQLLIDFVSTAGT